MQKSDIRYKNLRKAVKDGLSVFKTDEPLTGSQWADKFFYLSKESSNIHGKWESLPYQVAMLDWMTDPDIKIVDIQKSARIGYTKELLAAVGCFIEHIKRKVIIYQPTDGDAKGFVKDEVDTMMRDVKVLERVMTFNPLKKSPKNTNERKEFIGAVLHIKGGKAAKNYRRLTGDVVIYDELDAFDEDVEKEGSPLKLGDTRFKNSPFPKSIRGTTPKESKSSLIEKSIKNADFIFERYIKCPSCGLLTRLKWDHLFKLESPEPVHDIAFYCEENGCRIEYGDYPDADASGLWMTDNGEYYDEEERQFYSFDHEIIYPPRHIGVKIWAAYSYFSPWIELFSEWNEAARERIESGDNTKLKTFINTSLGESYEEKAERVSEDVFDDRLEKYRYKIPNEVLYITMAVDVQGGKNARLECEVCGWGIGQESWSLDYIEIRGEPEHTDVWDHLDEVRGRTFLREDGLELPISIVGVDSSYATDSVYKYTKPRQRWRVYSLKGDDGSWRPIVSPPRNVGKKRDTRLYLVGVDTAKERFYTRIKFKEPGPGYCHFPEWYPESYKKGLFSEEKKRKGKGFHYEKINAKIKNEPLDLKVYNLALIEIANPNFELLQRRLLRKLDAQKNNVPEPVIRRRRVRSEGVKA